MKINLLVIRTDQIEVQAKFYQSLGMEFHFHRHGKGPMHYSSTLGDVVFEIYPLLKSQKEVDISLRLGFEVSDLDQILQKLKSEGVEIIKEASYSEWGYSAIVKDRDGRKIELSQSPGN